MMTFSEQLSILGSGTMGHSIALAAALAGMEVRVWGTGNQDIERGRLGVAEKIMILRKHDVIDSTEANVIAARIGFTDSLEECISGATFIIEAVPENLALKQKLQVCLRRGQRN